MPLAALGRALDLALTAFPDRGVVEGFVLSEDRRFHLDTARAEVSINGRTGDYVPEWVERRSDDVYVDTRLVSRWLPLDLEVDLARSRLNVSPREPLPRMLRAERERRRAVLNRYAPTASGYPLHEDEYQLATVPAIDQTIQLRARETPDGERTRDALSTTYATADFLYMESAWYYQTGDGIDDDFRLTLSRRHPEPVLLGPLGAREVMLGHVNYPSLPLVARTRLPEPGFALSSYPLFQQTVFDRQSFRGDLPPGWEVELYHNGVLLDIQSPGSDGQYHFDDVPLLFGLNVFRLVFYGPLGQRREELHRFILGETLTPPGESYYRVTANRDDDGNERTVAQTDIGLHRQLSLTAGYASVPLSDGVQHEYAKLGLRSSWRNLFFFGDGVTDHEGGSAAEFGLRTFLFGMSIGVSRAELDDFVSEEFPSLADPVTSRDRVRLDTAIPLGFGPRLPFSLDVIHDTHVSGEERTEVQQRLAAFVAGTAITNTLLYRDINHERNVDGRLQFSRRLGRYGLRGELFYQFRPASEAHSADVLFEAPLGYSYHYRLGYTRLFLDDLDRYSVGINKYLGRFALGIDASYRSDGETTAGLILFAGFGREPRTPRWHSSSRPMASTAAATVLVFTDTNQNGMRDADESVIEGARFTVNGSWHPARTDRHGVAYIDHLPANQYVEIGLVPGSLEDPAWVPMRRGVRVLTRPGRVVPLDFPIAVTGEIDGTVRVQADGHLRELPGVEVQLVDPEGRVVSTANAAYDGYFYFSGVLPGEYEVHIAPSESARLNLGPYSKPVEVGSDGTIVSGVDLTPAQVRAPEATAPNGTPAVVPLEEPAEPPADTEEPAIEAPNPISYSVRKGDGLWALSRRFYGRGNEFVRILEANRGAIKDADLLYPDQVLFIPPRPTFVDVDGGEWVWEISRQRPVSYSPFRHFE